MLGFVQSWFKPGANPIGIDFGTDTLRLAQVEDGQQRVPPRRRRQRRRPPARPPRARPPAWSSSPRRRASCSPAGNFRGRKCVLALPAASMFVQHLRMARMDEAEMKKALPFEAAGKLPIDPSFAAAAPRRRRRGLPGPGAEERSRPDGRQPRAGQPAPRRGGQGEAGRGGDERRAQGAGRLLRARLPPQDRRRADELLRRHRRRRRRGRSSRGGRRSCSHASSRSAATTSTAPSRRR